MMRSLRVPPLQTDDRTATARLNPLTGSVAVRQLMAPTITWRSGSPTTTFSVPISTTTIGCSIQSVCWRADNMPGSGALILLGQQTILQLEGTAGCRLNLFLDSGPEVKMPIPKGPALDGTPKQCYHAVTQTVKSYSEFFRRLRRSEHCFVCAVKGGGTLPVSKYICNLQGSFTPGSPAIGFHKSLDTTMLTS